MQRASHILLYDLLTFLLTCGRRCAALGGLQFLYRLEPPTAYLRMSTWLDCG